MDRAFRSWGSGFSTWLSIPDPNYEWCMLGLLEACAGVRGPTDRSTRLVFPTG